MLVSVGTPVVDQHRSGESAFHKEQHMRVGLSLPLPNTLKQPAGDWLMHLAEQADQAGFATLAVSDHFAFRTPRQPDVTAWYEAWSVLAFFAARTGRIRLGTMVSGITLRNPAVLVKTAETLDALSNGRAYLGVGASPDFGEDEHRRMGLPFSSAGERIARLEEVLQMALQLWSGAEQPFHGTYYQLASTAAAPLFVQQPHPPILIGGYGTKMLRLMAKYADAVSIGFGQDLADLRTRLEILREQCQLLNRPYEQIEKITLFLAPLVQDGHLDPTALETFSALASLGFDEVMIAPPNDPITLDVLASELIPTVANIRVAGR
jgi:alkanesulfonate monooxygenase SsuD/methylene tetrahydromethanopterin reductase-like flavin-dependent oxidoreductase (luciferase family)